MAHDSTAQVIQHITEVRRNLAAVAGELERRGFVHDQTKLFSSIEKQSFDREDTQAPYGSPEYYEILKRLKPALDHHYQNNSHHPQYYPNGVSGMDLFDLIEMICDWRAYADSNVDLDENIRRFGIKDQVAAIIRNTLERWPKDLQSDKIVG